MASFGFTDPAAANNAYRFKTHAKQTRCFKTSCNATPDDDEKKLKTSIVMHKLDRRNLILGLGSLFGTSKLASLPSAFALPVAAPFKLSDSSALQSLGEAGHPELSQDPVTPVRQTLDKGSNTADNPVGAVKKMEDMETPVKLDQTVKVLVKRPAVNRSKEDKKKANEILLVNGVQFDGEKFVKFDVLVNDKDKETEITPAESEFAGSFASLPHNRSTEKMMMTSGVRFGLTELLEDIGAEDDEYVVVSLVPRTGCEDATVSEIKIELVPIV